MKHSFNIRSITVQLVLFALLISIIPASVITYTTSLAIGDMKNTQFEDKLSNLAIISDQAYSSRVGSDSALASVMAKDYSLETAIRDQDHIAMKRIVDRYANTSPNVTLLDVADTSGNVVASASFINVSDRLSDHFIASALEGHGMAGTDLVPASVLKSNYVDFKTVSSGTADGLGIICAQPIKDETGKVLGVVYLVDLLNENTDLVDKIAAAAKGESTIYMGDVRIATSMKNEYGVRKLGTKAASGVAANIIGSGGSYRGYEDVNRQHIYVDYEPLRNPEGRVVGMMAAGYDVNPSLAEIDTIAYLSILRGLVIAIASSIVGFMLVRRITKPVHGLVEAAKKVAAGKLDTPLETVPDTDEIGELHCAIRKMVDSIKERIYYSESIIQSISDPMLAIDREDRISFINKPATELTGFSMEGALGKRYTDVFEIIEVNGATINEHLNKRRVIRSFEGGIRGQNGKKTIVRGSCAPILAANGTVIGTIVLLRDVTKEIEVSDQIKASLREKEVLLKEIHHRVKNNLQVISSLLSLQSAYVKDSEALNMFKESQNRVKSMALIHERLYQSDNLYQVDFKDYIRKLTSSLAYSYNLNEGRVRITIDSESALLSIDTAIPCGLIINELLTNAFKYAFPDGRSGLVRIALHRTGEGSHGSQYQLTFADNGVGLPSEIDPRETTTLGLQLVTILTDQIGGNLAVNRRDGTVFVITFSEAKAARPASSDSQD